MLSVRSRQTCLCWQAKMIWEAHIDILAVHVALSICLPGGHSHEEVHGALMLSPGVVKLLYLLVTANHDLTLCSHEWRKNKDQGEQEEIITLVLLQDQAEEPQVVAVTAGVYCQIGQLWSRAVVVDIVQQKLTHCWQVLGLQNSFLQVWVLNRYVYDELEEVDLLCS